MQIAYAFRCCASLKHTKNFFTIKVIDNGAFHSYKLLLSVELYGGIEIIGKFVFQHCASLRGPTIPLKAQASCNFEGCHNFLNSFSLTKKWLVVLCGAKGLWGCPFINCATINHITLDSSKIILIWYQIKVDNHSTSCRTWLTTLKIAWEWYFSIFWLAWQSRNLVFINPPLPNHPKVSSHRTNNGAFFQWSSMQSGAIPHRRPWHSWSITRNLHSQPLIWTGIRWLKPYAELGHL